MSSQLLVKCFVFNSSLLQNCNEWIFDLRQFDWLIIESEQHLSDFKFIIELIQLLENNIDDKIFYVS